jgi:hypothetical protein
VPLLIQIAASDNAQLRSTCAGVLAVMLGKYAKPWLEDTMKAAKTAPERQRLKAALEQWGRYMTGEGYWADHEE